MLITVGGVSVCCGLYAVNVLDRKQFVKQEGHMDTCCRLHKRVEVTCMFVPSLPACKQIGRDCERAAQGRKGQLSLTLLFRMLLPCSVAVGPFEVVVDAPFDSAYGFKLGYCCWALVSAILMLIRELRIGEGQVARKNGSSRGEEEMSRSSLGESVSLVMSKVGLYW